LGPRTKEINFAFGPRRAAAPVGLETDGYVTPLLDDAGALVKRDRCRVMASQWQPTISERSKQGEVMTKAKHRGGGSLAATQLATLRAIKQHNAFTSIAARIGSINSTCSTARGPCAKIERLPSAAQLSRA